MKLPQRSKSFIVNASILAFSVFVFLGLLNQTMNLSSLVPFHDWDEAIYAQVAKEFARAPSEVLTYNGSPWFEKPPLPSVLYATSWILPIKRELGARLVSLLLGLTSIFVLYKILASLKIPTFLSILAVFAALQSPMFRDRSVLVNVDIMLTAGWLIYSLGQVKQSYTLKIFGTLIGTLSKSVLGFIPLCADILANLVFQKVTKSKILEWVTITLLGSLWHLYMTLAYGDAFIQSHFMDHLVARVIRPIELHFGNKWFYLEKLFGETNVFLVLAFIGFALVAYVHILRLRKSESLPKASIHLFFLAVLPASYLALLTVSKSKLHWYITPLIPFVAIWAAIFFDSVIKTRYAVMSKIAKIFCALIGVYSIFVFAKSINYIQPDWHSPTDKTIIGICLGKALSPSDRITYLVPKQERIDANVIEAANLQIGSSFVYGSAPAFLYYADKPVNFVYKEKEYAQSLARNTVTVLSRADATDAYIRKPVEEWLSGDITVIVPICETDTLVAFRKAL